MARTRDNFQSRLPLAMVPFFLAAGICLGRIHAQEISTAKFSDPKRICELEKKDIYESSGLAVSNLQVDQFWTHNDSGDKPRLFAFDSKGRHLGTSQVKGADALDWEDMASATIGGEAILLIGDVGDNRRIRKHCTIYLVLEPKNPKKDCRIKQRIDFRFESGPVDCESIAYDPTGHQVLLIEKRLSTTSRVYSLPLSPPAHAGGRDQTVGLAKKIGSIRVPFATGMDISRDGRYLVVCTYTSGTLFQRKDKETWSQALTRPGAIVPLPLRPQRLQGETICFGLNGKSIFATSEKRPTPLFQIKILR